MNQLQIQEQKQKQKQNEEQFFKKEINSTTVRRIKK